MMGSSSFFNQQSNRGIMGEVYTSSNSSSGVSPVLSESESSKCDNLMEEVENGALNDMSSLLQQLPFKRGLSKHFQGKSQSFTSLSNVSCLEDLAKPEHPCNKKLKSCRSASSSRLISKKSSRRASCFSLTAKRSGTFIGISSNKPPPS